jgi:hypothetical protein
MPMLRIPLLYIDDDIPCPYFFLHHGWVLYDDTNQKYVTIEVYFGRN